MANENISVNLIKSYCLHNGSMVQCKDSTDYLRYVYVLRFT